MSEDGLVRPCLVTITGWMNLGILFVLAHDYGRRWYDRVYQLPPYSEVVHILDSHKNMKGLFIYFFHGCGAWGSTPALIALWRRGTHRGHVSDFDWPRGLVSGENLFKFPEFFKAKPFDFFPSFSHFFIFSLRLVFLTSLVAHFALSLLSFLPNFQVRPLFTLFSFLNFTCIPIF